MCDGEDDVVENPKTKLVKTVDVQNNVAQAVEELALSLSSLIEDAPDLAVMCIGTDRSTGDAVGPLVGMFLQKWGMKNVYGTLQDPVHAVNLKERLQEVKAMHPGACILAVDACVGRLEYVGTIRLYDRPIKPGQGVCEDLPEVGDISIAAVVGPCYGDKYLNLRMLQTRSLNKVMKMAEIIAGSIYLARMCRRYPHYRREPLIAMYSHVATSADD